jgi:GntR family transcriptional regulator
MNRSLPDRDTIDPDSATPLYKQLYQIIMKAIEDGTFQPGDKIPSEDNLQKQFGLSRITIRKALQVLVDEETLMRIHGKGTFVTQGGFTESVFTGGSFTDTCLRMNAKPATRLISRGLEVAKPRIAKKLGLQAGGDIIHIQRLRLVNGLACILEQDYCPPDLRFLMEAELQDVSIFRLIKDKLTIVPEGFEDHFEVWYPSKKEASLLECDPAMALLRVSQLISVRGGVLYYNEQLIRSDRYKYAVRYL